MSSTEECLQTKLQCGFLGKTEDIFPVVLQSEISHYKKVTTNPIQHQLFVLF